MKTICAPTIAFMLGLFSHFDLYAICGMMRIGFVGGIAFCSTVSCERVDAYTEPRTDHPVLDLRDYRVDELLDGAKVLGGDFKPRTDVPVLDWSGMDDDEANEALERRSKKYVEADNTLRESERHDRLAKEDGNDGELGFFGRLRERYNQKYGAHETGAWGAFGGIVDGRPAVRRRSAYHGIRQVGSRSR